MGLYFCLDSMEITLPVTDQEISGGSFFVSALYIRGAGMRSAVVLSQE